MSLLLAVSTPPVVVAAVAFVQTAPPVDLPTGRPGFLVGATLIAAGTLLAPHPLVAQPAMAPGSITLLRGAVLAPAGRVLAADSSFGQPALPTGSPTLLRGAAPPSAGIPLSAAPATNLLPTPTSRILIGALPPSGTMRSAPVTTEAPWAPTCSLLRGAVLPSAGPVLAPHPSFGQPPLPTGQPTLLRGAFVGAGGRLLAPTPRTEPPSAPTGAILRGATPPSAVTVLRATYQPPDLPIAETKLLFVSKPPISSILIEPHIATRQTKLPEGSIEIYPDPLLPAAGNVMEPVSWPTPPATPRSTLLEGGYSEPPPPPPYDGPAPIPRVGRFANVSNAAGGGGAVSWISLPGGSTELVQGNWTRDPITIEQDGTLAPGWWDQIMARSGFAGLARIAPAPMARSAVPVALGQLYLNIAQQVAAVARTEQARRIALEQALHQELITRYALEQRVQMLTAQLDDARHPAEDSIPIVATMPHVPIYYPEPDPAWFTSLGEETPNQIPAPRRRLWPVVAVGAAVAAVAILFVTATSAPPPARRKRRRPKRA